MAAIAGAFLLPQLAEAAAPEVAGLGFFALDAGGALVGCLIYEALSFGSRA